MTHRGNYRGPLVAVLARAIRLIPIPSTLRNEVGVIVADLNRQHEPTQDLLR
jgi:hypothetical protein